jgi:hypothetical protein
MVATLAVELRSPFGARKPRRREKLQKKNKENRGRGYCPNKHPPLALRGEEAPKKGGLWRGNGDNQGERPRTCKPGFQLERESHTVNTTGHEKLRNCKKTSDRIKPIELDYLVAALVDAVHSLHRGRKP